MSKMRRHMNRRKSGRLFKRTAMSVKPQNGIRTVLRGGYRL